MHWLRHTRGLKSGKSARRPSHHLRFETNRKLLIEPLEDRRLLSVTAELAPHIAQLLDYGYSETVIAPSIAETAFDAPGSANAVFASADNGITYNGTSTPATIGGIVWNDLNGNGIRDAGESGMAGVGVNLHSSTDGTIGNSDDVSCGTAVTDANGSYSFTGVSDGLNY
jgi:hypothetical protein